jgi:predicted nucleic acid-binding protein
VIDTSALVAGTVADHVHDDLAREELRGGLGIPAIVMAETFALRRRAFGLTAAGAESLLHPWTAGSGPEVGTPDGG